MVESVYLYKYLSTIVQVIGYLGAVGSGLLLYSGLTSKLEKNFLRLRFEENMKVHQQKFKENAQQSTAEKLFRDAGYPLKINNLRWIVIQSSFILFLALNYILVPLIIKGNYSIWAPIIIAIVLLFTWTSFPYSLTHIALKKLNEYKKIKQRQELFSLYDMLLSEIEMMDKTRINAYSILRSLKPYFKELNGPLTRLLTNWTSNMGPELALDLFAEELDTKEAKSLVTTLKRFDDSKKEALIQSLSEMKDMFSISQIESYRRKRKVQIDLASIPIKVAHFSIILNFLIVIVYMVTNIMADSKL